MQQKFQLGGYSPLSMSLGCATAFTHSLPCYATAKENIRLTVILKFLIRGKKFIQIEQFLM